MPFVESAESLRSKLHLGDAKAAAVAGVVVVALAIAALVAVGAAALLPHAETQIVKAEDAPESETTSAGVQVEQTAFVHVTGAVANPGMYEVAEGARVQDVVEAAGVFSDDAAESALNLARIVADGEQIVVPSMSDVDARQDGSATDAGAQSNASGQGAFSSDGSMIGGKVNINAASAEQLDGLPGIGQATAQKIVADREANGPFSSKEDLQRVSGIGAKKYAQLEDLICVG